MQTKVADGQAKPLALIDLAKFLEVPKYCSLTNPSWGGRWFVASSRVWKPLPVDVQQGIARQKNSAARKGDGVALLAASGAQTETIPPSLVLITVGSITGMSIAALLTGSMLPGAVMGLALCAVMGWHYRREDLSRVKRATAAVVGQTPRVALPAIALPFVIRAAGRDSGAVGCHPVHHRQSHWNSLGTDAFGFLAGPG
jgi:hypothetical protein